MSTWEPPNVFTNVYTKVPGDPGVDYYRPPYLSAVEVGDDLLDPCPGGHIIDESEGSKPIEYLDGLIAGYCCTCRCRITFAPFVGGLTAKWASMLSVQVLSSDLDPDLMGQFTETIERLEQDKQAVDSALETARMVKEVVAYRLRNV